jgi:tetratricopeptide (TPR) repeat protein
MNLKNKKRVLFEISLIAIILIQAFVIFTFYQGVSNNSLSHAKKIVGNYSCPEKLLLLEAFEELADFEAILSYGEMLLENGFATDPVVLITMAKAYYVKGNTPKAIEFLNKSIDGNYVCDFTWSPKEKYLDWEKALAIHNLAELYQETGNSEQANIEFEKSFTLAKKAFGEKYNENVFLRLCDETSFLKLKKYKDT